ncbi:MAG: hypothetical protein WC906_00545 [Parcubacteria group bacterium]
MKEVNYLEIIKKSWKITWENKYLWWFGLLLFLGGGTRFNFPGNSEWSKKAGENEEQFRNFLNQHWQLVAGFIVFVVMMCLALIILKLIAKAGLIKALDKVEKKLSVNFKEGFREGKKYFWKILAIGLILGFFIFVLLVVLAIPITLLFSARAFVLGAFSAFFALAIFIPLVVLASFIGKYSIYYVVLSNLGIKASIENGYQIFRKNIIPSIVMALFFIPINIALFILIVTALLSIGTVFLLVGIVLYFTLAKIGVVIAVSLGIFVFIVILFLANSIFQVFCQTTWFLFFREIATVKEEEKIKEVAPEKSTIKKILPEPEEA